jgi:hypothetical protein
MVKAGTFGDDFCYPPAQGRTVPPLSEGREAIDALAAFIERCHQLSSASRLAIFRTARCRAAASPAQATSGNSSHVLQSPAILTDGGSSLGG